MFNVDLLEKSSFNANIGVLKNRKYTAADDWHVKSKPTHCINSFQLSGLCVNVPITVVARMHDGSCIEGIARAFAKITFLEANRMSL